MRQPLAVAGAPHDELELSAMLVEYSRHEVEGGVTARTLSCWLGRHSWTSRADHGESYEICSVCGKLRQGVVQDSFAVTDDIYRRAQAKRPSSVDRLPDEQ